MKALISAATVVALLRAERDRQPKSRTVAEMLRPAEDCLMSLLTLHADGLPEAVATLTKISAESRRLAEREYSESRRHPSAKGRAMSLRDAKASHRQHDIAAMTLAVLRGFTQ